MVSGTEGGITKYYGKPDVAAAVSGGRSSNPAAETAAATTGEQMSIYEAAMKYQKDNVPLVILAGTEYGTGSSRDWAAKGTLLLGVKAVVASSFERIHRSNLIGMGVLPLEFQNNENHESLGIKGDEIFSLIGVEQGLQPNQELILEISRNGKAQQVKVIA